MTAIKKLLLALTMLSATAGVQASDSTFSAFGREKGKKASNLIHRVSFEEVSVQAAPWGQSLVTVLQSDYRTGYAPLSGQYNGIKLRPQDLQGRYDIPRSDC
ncbi:hypothetical protein IFT37_06260 [Pseudomonas fluorescens]|uniref:Uncharacterized protein n=1 Tax=Pseudomonas fluorescens TaxID=294 RepID=A0AAE2Q4P6_PSEFL|nr:MULTISPECIES: hypothetical protein [Pseudomonas fluorescens group]MBD8149903.1 hypothetical protein [Pseudomonas fluorescens]MBD8176951.1 hypothetical protein [Pseudomonas fluorescens]MBD8273423.1 hypothetical protein [Pseudomonas fluorescens]MBD8744701.1 hypothetical protein [Pseudomonas fluorescens]MBD8749596.1 hypothetical protein [Pseudomonas fluorescens]